MHNPLTAQHRSHHITAALLAFALSSSGCFGTPVKPGVSTRERALMTDDLIQENPKPVLPDPDAISASDTGFDGKTGEIRYTLPQPAYVRIRIGLNQGGALLRTLLDWEYRSAGKHVEKWDRKDAFGKIDFGQRPDYLLVLNARSEHAKSGYPKAPRLTITFPESGRQTDQGVPIVSDIAAMRVELDPEDSRRLSESQFEVAVYADTVFMMEDEIATNPFNYRIDVSQFNEGEHVMTVNVISYDGQVGAASVKMYVEK